MAVAVLLPDPLILVFATGPPTTQPVDPVATTRPGAAGRHRGVDTHLGEDDGVEGYAVD